MFRLTLRAIKGDKMKKLILVIVTILCITVDLFSENRVALLIANGAYKNFSSLTGPTTEAEALSLTLKSLGFDVKLLKNATREQMLDELDNLKARVNGKGGIAFFHYGGHAVQLNGANYLIPVDADIPDEKKVTTRTVNIEEVMSSFDSCGSDTNIIILDACRNNPLPAGSGRSASRGLSVISAKPKNSVIVYSAEAGTVAQDGLFTPTLTRYLQDKNISFSDVLLKVRNEVNQKSKGTQIPGEYNQLFNNIYLNGFGQSIVINSSNLATNVDKPTGIDFIINGNFKRPLNPNQYWFGGPDIENGNVSYTAGVEKGYLVISIKKNNSGEHMVQGGFICDKEILFNHRYKVSFDVKSTIDDIKLSSIIYEKSFGGAYGTKEFGNAVDSDGDGQPWTLIHREDYFIGIETQKIEYEFKMNKKNLIPVIWFYLGNNPSNIKIYISNLSMIEIF